MKKRYLFALLAAISLASCSKTELLYGENAYNSPVFDENYYLDREDIDELKINQVNQFTIWSSKNGLDAINAAGFNPENRPWLAGLSMDKSEEFGYHNNLDSIEEDFNYGILSKLYDGRVRCEGYYQKSRVQLNKTGYATYFPKSLISAKYFAFSVRGGTSLKNPLSYGPEFKNEGDPGFANRALSVNFTVSFYKFVSETSSYEKLTYQLNNVNVQCDNGGDTNLVYFPLLDYELNGVVAMSMEWNCNDPRLAEHNLTDDYLDKEKDHLAMMLYEVFLGQSTWY